MENFGFDFMLASDASERAEEILSGEEYRNWVMEPKLDGIRAMVHVDNGEVRVFLRGRGAKDSKPVEKTDNYPFLKSLAEKGISGVTLDGELVCFGDARPQYDFMNNDLFKMISINGSLPERAIELQKRWVVAYIPFDILRVDGKAVTTLGFLKRRALLEQICSALGISPIQEYENNYSNYEMFVVNGGEGAVVKKPTAIYSPTRSACWLKLKKFDDMVAYFANDIQSGQGRLAGLIGSVLVCDKFGNKLGYVSGLSDELRHKMTFNVNDNIQLNPEYVGKQVLIRHNGETGRGGFRHARVIKISEGEDLEVLR